MINFKRVRFLLFNLSGAIRCCAVSNENRVDEVVLSICNLNSVTRALIPCHFLSGIRVCERLCECFLLPLVMLIVEQSRIGTLINENTLNANCEIICLPLDVPFTTHTHSHTDQIYGVQKHAPLSLSISFAKGMRSLLM